MNGTARPASSIRAELCSSGLLRLTLDRPRNRNALDIPMLRALATAMTGAETLGARAVTIESEGPIFSAGGDLGDLRLRPDQQHEALVEFVAAFDVAPVPVICFLSGRAIGAGAIPALLGDVTLVTSEARLEFPEMGFGLFPAMMVEVLAERIGRAHAVTIGLGGQSLDAAAMEAHCIATERANRAPPTAESWALERAIFYSGQSGAVLLARRMRRAADPVARRVDRSGAMIREQLDSLKL